MFGPILHAIRVLTESVKVNSMRCVAHDGQRFWRKQRQLSARFILPLTNVFFWLAKAPLRTQPSACKWQAWGLECFAGLHGGEGFTVRATERFGYEMQELPGINLTDYLDTDRLTTELAEAAGRELRRAHGWHCPSLGAAWSHGDAHAGNFMLEEHPLRARIIDFEPLHLSSLSAAERQADDVAAFLLDLVGRISAEKWLPCAQGFLRGYGSSPRLENNTVGFFAGVWRGVQTGFLAEAELRRRLAQLAQAEQPSEFAATTHSLTGTPPSR